MGIDPSFVRIGADWSSEEALQVLDSVGEINYAIVHGFAGEMETFHVFDVAEIDIADLQADPRAIVRQALKIDERRPTPVASEEQPRRRSVIVRGGRIIGVSDPPTGSRGGNTRDFLPAESARRALTASVPETLGVGKKTLVDVRLTVPAAPGENDIVGVKSGDTIDLVLAVSGSISIQGSNTASVVLDGTREIVTRFEIVGQSAGPGHLDVFALSKRAPVARLQFTIDVVVEAPSWTEPVERKSRVEPSYALADLTALVLEDKTAGTYKMLLTSADPELGVNTETFGPIVLGGDPEKFFADFYRDIESILESTDSPESKADELNTKGDYLAKKVMPKELLARLWELRDRIKSVQVQTDEPWVPWELCRLSGSDAGGRKVEGKFLAEQFEVTRWFLGIPFRPTLTLRSIGLVVPPSSGLKAASIEKDFMLGLDGADRKVTKIEPRAYDLRLALKNAAHDSIHFVGHGTAVLRDADRSTIALEGDRRFGPPDLSGAVANLQEKSPLVFLNACEVGRAGKTLGGTAGWPQAFVGEGAGAFIGAFWRIKDSTAALFTKTFYAELIAGATVAAAVHKARATVRDAGDPTWLAYVVYAHPHAKIAQ